MNEENYMFIHIISIVGSRCSLESNYDCFKTMVTKLVPLLGISVEILLFNAKLILKQDCMVPKLGPVLFECRDSCELS